MAKQDKPIRISVTGDPGSGKTTFTTALAEKTGYKVITAGSMFRAIAADMGVSVTRLNQLAEEQADIDNKVDDYLVSLNNTDEDIILDSRMAWHFVQDTFKVRLTARPEVAAARIYGDPRVLREKFSSLAEAVEDVANRRASELRRYKMLYDVMLSDPANFDVVIDTSDIPPEETLRRFEKAFEMWVD